MKPRIALFTAFVGLIGVVVGAWVGSSYLSGVATQDSIMCTVVNTETYVSVARNIRGKSVDEARDLSEAMIGFGISILGSRSQQVDEHTRESARKVLTKVKAYCAENQASSKYSPCNQKNADIISSYSVN
jgi:hypothetical protein